MFYRNLDQSNELEQWDVAVGLLTADWTRLEDWLDWDPKELAYGEDAVDGELWNALARGIELRHEEIRAVKA